MKRGEREGETPKAIEEILRDGKLTREKFFEIFETTSNPRQLSSEEFLGLLEIIRKQRREIAYEKPEDIKYLYRE